MFKIESYITPILLSYVDKYIKNFRLEDSQVSLWGGDASFHNLDLRLEVLEQELQIPFSFVSGHIRELLIHVPWTKLAWEPITITINTIECILKLKGADSGSASESSGTQTKDKPKRPSKQDLEAPPGYLASLINKIVANIRIYCNNLILKYVEEDIVLSMNVKHLKFESANEKWEPFFTEIALDEITLRKVVQVNDLTICLDKRNAAGKIEIYQEPMLYKCSMTIHLLRSYHPASVSRTSRTRLDIFCESMEFGMSEQQIPMMIRLTLLLFALKKKKITSDVDLSNVTNTAELVDNYPNNESWTGWAWSYVSSAASVFTPHSSQEYIDNEDLSKSGHIMQLGFYVDRASVVFKVTESSTERGYYTHKKLRYMPVLILELQGIYMETIINSPTWYTSTMGVSEILFCPLGHCSCAFLETPDGSKPQPYFSMGAPLNLHKTNSLFDEEAIENTGGKKLYNNSWDFHMLTYSESALLERTPAFVYDYIHEMAIPDDLSLENLFELGSDFEYSNVPERDFTRMGFAPFKLRLCSGFLHRMSSLVMAAMTYDYEPYFVPQPDPSLQELLPPSEEDFDALSEFIPMTTMKVTFFAPTIEVQMADHPYFVPKKGKLYKKHKKVSSHNQPPQKSEGFMDLPKVTIECQCLDIVLIQPLYVNRLVYTTCQLPDPPRHLFDSCFKKLEIKVLSFTSRLIINSKCQTTILMPFNARYVDRKILKPQYWTDSDVTHTEITIESESLTLNGTKAKMLVIYEIFDKLYQPNPEVGQMVQSSLIADASSEDGFPYLEFYVEGARFRKVTTCSTVSIDTSLGSVKAFIFETVDQLSALTNKNIQQVLFISGPEPKKDKQSKLSKLSADLPLFSATVQYPLAPAYQTHPAILVYTLQEIRICFDPLVCKWFLYKPKITPNSDVFINFVDSSTHRIRSSESSLNAFEPSRKMSTHIESIHGSSDKDHSFLRKQKILRHEHVDIQERIYNFLKNWFDVWKTMVLWGEISQCTIYFPLVSLSAVGAQGIQETVDKAINKKDPPEIMIITLPFATNYCSQRQSIQKYITKLPLKLPENVWTPEKSSFPWTVTISNLNCYTIQGGKKLEFLQRVSLSATVGLSTKPSSNTKVNLPGAQSTDSGLSSATSASTKNDIGGLGVCVHIDTTPILISTSEVQVYLFANILYGLLEIIANLPSGDKQLTKVSEPIISEKGSVTGLLLTDISPDAPTHSRETSSINLLMTDNMDDENAKLTAWIQWTITRFTIELNSSSVSSKKKQPKLKLVIDTEDIVSSLDFQSVYMKVKTKIGSMSIEHFQCDSKNKWQPGPFLGMVMKHRDDILNEIRHEENAFMSITITRASCQHTHTLWGTLQRKKREGRLDSNALGVLQSSKYITEIVITVQPIDFIFSFQTLRTFYLVLEPLMEIPTIKRGKQLTNVTFINNQILPLAYLDCYDIRVIMPVSGAVEKPTDHDVYIFQINKIALSPNAVNPICRSPYRPDIYQHAARMRILNIPGSDVEDRQYQLDISGISLSTSTWRNVDQMLNQPVNILSNLHGTSENPALEWNYLDKGSVHHNPASHLWQVIDKFDLSIVAAPAMLYKGDILVCCNSVEVNIVSEIVVMFSLYQIKLILALIEEFNQLLQPLAKLSSKMKIHFPYTQFVETANTRPEIDAMRDSGIECHDFKSMDSSKKADSFSKNTPEKPCSVKKTMSSFRNNGFEPGELLVTGGKISFFLYEVNSTYPLWHSKRDKITSIFIRNIEHEEANTSNSTDLDGEEFIPLMFCSFSQPNLYFSDQHNVQKINFYLFNVALKMSNPEHCPIRSIPTEKDYQISLLDTLAGTPHPDTGIPPAFLTVTLANTLSGGNCCLDIEIAKPTKIFISTQNCYYFISIYKRVKIYLFHTRNQTLQTFPSLRVSTASQLPLRVQESHEHYTKYNDVKELICDINSINIRTNQIVVTLMSKKEDKLRLTIGKMYNGFMLLARPDKIVNTFSLECVSIVYQIADSSHLILNPWTVSIDSCFFWESWQYIGDNPQVQITAESECIMMEICPERLKNLQELLDDFNEMIAFFNEDKSEDIETKPGKSPQVIGDVEQHYKDDLRAGAFQFVDSSTNNVDELPLPYQIMFWNKNISAMAWRYPHPRCLTKVRVFPVPYKSSVEPENDLDIFCCLEYWSECHSSYLPYAQFVLPEDEILHLDLPTGNPQPPVACTWRIVINAKSTHTGRLLEIQNFSSKSLAACVRIDSYFNNLLIPNLTVALVVSRINVALYTFFDKDRCRNLPRFLKNYIPDMMFPSSHCFCDLSFDNFRLYSHSWNLGMFQFDLNTSICCYVLDYAFLTRQPFIEPFGLRLVTSASKHLNCDFITKQISIKFSPSIVHTLAISTQSWNQHFNMSDNDSTMDFLVATRYVVCNDTNVNIRFGQSNTDEDIVLMPKNFHLYSWRSQKHKQYLSVGIEHNAWLWSNPFPLDFGTYVIELCTEKSIGIVVTVKKLSETQYQVTFSGQIVIANMLLEHFEFKILEAEEGENKPIISQIASGNSVTLSMVVNYSKKYFLRLRFYGLDASWSGDIPLMEHAKSVQPWLVKVPLLEKGQFLSIWCRVVVQEFNTGKKTLAMLWPLFTIKSNLPINAQVHIETPTLNFKIDSTVRGKGELQQLYCPGTIDHSHQLTFQLDNTSTSKDPYVPLNYSLVDHQTFFKKMDKESIEDVIEVLRTHRESKWPYFGEELADIDWITPEQPETHVQVRYQNSCQYSSSLLVEILPWCLMVNTLGVTIGIKVNGVEICTLCHSGLITPPKLDENFKICIYIGSKAYSSDVLYFGGTVTWSDSFYMPKILGIIPNEGIMITQVNLNNHICRLTVRSNIVNEIRLLQISSTHILCNHTSELVQVMCFTVPNNGIIYDIPTTTEVSVLSVEPHLEKRNQAISVIKWYVVDTQLESNTGVENSYYMTFSIAPKFGWSCPVKVDEIFIRKSVCVTSANKSVPIAVTSYEFKGQMCISLHHDTRPQTYIENICGDTLYCAQYNNEEDKPVLECKNFKWHCEISDKSKNYFTMPTLNEKFPDISLEGLPERVIFSVDPFDKDKEDCWSSPLDITTDGDYYIKIPFHADVKIIVKTVSCLTFIKIESVSKFEVSAKDIRSRLSQIEDDVKLKFSRNNQLEHNPIVSHSISACALKTTTEMVEYPEDIQRSLSATFLSKRTVGRRESEDDLTFIQAQESCSSVRMGHYFSMLKEWTSLKATIFINTMVLTLLTDIDPISGEVLELANFTCDNVTLVASQTERVDLCLTIQDMQLDNQMYSRATDYYFDFPVVLVNQTKIQRAIIDSVNVPLGPLLEMVTVNPLLKMECILDTWIDPTGENVTGIQDLKMGLKPFCCYIEDKYYSILVDYFNVFTPLNLILLPDVKKPRVKPATSEFVHVPEIVLWQGVIQARPLTIRNLLIEPVGIQLSVHSSVKMYVALDQSPLYFNQFERSRVYTNAYRLGHTLTMHYLSGAIFKAGWMVSSLEILGSPAGLARAMGSGLQDFVYMPFRGLVHGPVEFLWGVTNGTASLMKHVTAGTLQSVTKMASSVARNLDRLTMDEEHLRRTEEQRRQRPQGVTEGLVQGLTGLGISILGAIGGIAHHPLQSVITDGGSPRSLATGLGLGIVGIITKPLSGAAELLALTGQGLLQGAGWTSMPEARAKPVLQHIYSSNSSILKFEWKVTMLNDCKLIHITEATSVSPNSQYAAVVLIITNRNLIIVNSDDDTIQNSINLTELEPIRVNNDPSLLSLKLLPAQNEINIEEQDELRVEMDPACKARVAEYIKNTVGLMEMSNNEDKTTSEMSVSPLTSPGGSKPKTYSAPVLSFYVNPQNRNYFLCLLSLSKNENFNNYHNYPVL